MTPSLLEKLTLMVQNFERLEGQLADPATLADKEVFAACAKEHAALAPIVEAFVRWQQLQGDLKENETLKTSESGEMLALIEEDIKTITESLKATEATLHQLLLPKDPDDERSVYLEIRAGTGGDEAALFVGDLFRMYCRYSDLKKWKTEVVSEHASEVGGYKEIIVHIRGKEVYGHLKFESGAHRVQRVPTTESGGRIHTSACTVAVLPEASTIDRIELKEADLRIDTYRSSGAGGQHVNTTDSAVRITHIPTNIVAECQDERSQHKNKAKAMALLQTKILSEQKRAQQQERAETRRNLVGSGDRSERIRTYNFPQGRITDHRINLTLYKIEECLSGDLDLVIKPLLEEHQADLMASMDTDA